jgi:pimeloyl-ACP methyl ester carboxylesterase
VSVDAPVGRTGFALLPGAGLGPWIWRDVAPLLRFPHLACDYPGRSGRDSTAGKRLADYADHVVRQIAGWDVEGVILVAHSIGGVVALPVAEALAPRIRGLVGLSAVVPADGGSFVSALPLPRRVLIGTMIRLLGTRPPASVIRAGVAGDLTDELAAELVERFTPEPRRLYTDPAASPVPSVPLLYVRTTDDRELPPHLQDRVIEQLGTARVVDLASGHLSMLGAPAALADVLNDFAASLESTSL